MIRLTIASTCTAYSNVTAYSENVMGIREVNVHMTGNAVQATDQLCKSLKFLVLQTGTNVSPRGSLNRAADQVRLEVGSHW